MLHSSSIVFTVFSYDIQAIKVGGRKEYDAIKTITAKPKTPQMGIAGMRAMGASKDKALQGAF